MSAAKTRLDHLLVERGLVASRSVARGLILAGAVSVNGVRVDKCGTLVPSDACLALAHSPRFVSRAGEKLAHALEVLPVAVAGRLALDVGASTGGFVDCLLQNGAARVIALDVGRGQLDYRLRLDERVVVMEGVNARALEPSMLPYRPSLLTMDVSFISVEKVMPAVLACMDDQFDGLVLVKPQFEAGRRSVGKGGIVRDAAVWRDVLGRIATRMCQDMGLAVRAVIDSGLPGMDGNREFFLWLARGGEEGLAPDNLAAEIELATAERMPDGNG